MTALATICREAAARHGDDWRAVTSFIKASLDALPRDQRATLAVEIDRLLRYRAPESGSRTQ